MRVYHNNTIYGKEEWNGFVAYTEKWAEIWQKLTLVGISILIGIGVGLVMENEWRERYKKVR